MVTVDAEPTHPTVCSVRMMSIITDAAWDTFASGANWGQLHSNDLDRFAEFVIVCQENQEPTPNFRKLVAPYTDDPIIATHLYGLHDFGLKMIEAVAHAVLPGRAADPEG
jgi:hypothetical protein